MFLDLFYGLREAGVPVAIQEWQALMTALEHGLHGASLDRFYYVARACLVKSEAYFDAFDMVFARVFHGIEGSLPIEEELLDGCFVVAVQRAHRHLLSPRQACGEVLEGCSAMESSDEDSE